MVEVQERGLGTFEQHVRSCRKRCVEEPDGVGDEGRNPRAERVEVVHDLVDVERVATRLFDEGVLGDGPLAYELRETCRIEHVAHAETDAPGENSPMSQPRKSNVSRLRTVSTFFSPNDTS